MRCVVGLSRGCVSAAIVRLWLRSGGGGGGLVRSRCPQRGPSYCVNWALDQPVAKMP